MKQSSTPHVTYWNTGTRLLHWGMAVTVSFQLLISLIMEHPKPGRVLTSTQALSFELHEWVGLATVGVIIAHWVWSALLTRDDSGFRHLFPWDAKGRAKLLVELRQILRFQLPQGGPEGGLAGLVHGLGFLAVSTMAATGAVLFFIYPKSGAETPFVGNVADLHSLIANLAWVYWYGHIGMALLHEILGHRVLARIFLLRQ
ncbi:cytochrome b/b6 domain-containing protein [Acidithiobacillus ferriphilus]|uniref:cytochrome b/b6 domain-containing protein n=1 Tax=Acidithiobacillus ferriphilus TaxID=1689834 RepID=UPI0023307B77|nr:cytochrome b/b6 domain-containing protein [Acidithiobacillus ferriphilus]WCE93055.1 cytochrome b/b6 domain-containing protein [Acidithiobacillus ferriphilus]